MSSNSYWFLTDGGCGGLGIGFGLSGNVTFHFKIGKFDCGSHWNANAHNSLLLRGAILSISITAFY